MRDLLVIDDSATVRKLVELSMRGTDLRPHFAATGSEGVHRAAALAPSAILLDCVLPDMTGLDVCGALAADARTAGIPILVVTAKHERTRVEFQPFTSVVDFIGKPFTAPDLIARVERAIGDASGPRPTRELAQRAARILYQRLRDGLGQIPSLLSELEPGHVAPALAKRLLTPEVMEHVLVDLRPLYEELLASGPVTAGPAPRNDTIVDRAPGFSARVAGATLGSLDRRVLALSDGKTTLSAMADRLGTDVRQIAAAASGLVVQGLLVELAAVPRPRPVLICEPDADAFEQPLRAMLQQRPVPRELIAIEQLGELVGAARQHHPCLVLVNATSRIDESRAVAEALRTERALRDLALVAVTEPRAGLVGPELLAAGFDAVFAKPILIGELERFLSSSSPR